MTVTKKDIVEKVASEFGSTKGLADEIVNEVFEAMKDSLEKGKH